MRALAVATPSKLPVKPARRLRTVLRTASVRSSNARGIGRHVDTYA